MKKLLVISLITGIYLCLSYAYIYNFPGQHHLTAPAHEIKTIVGNNLTNPIIKYVSLGDSLAAGVGASDYKNSYPYLLAGKLSAKNNVELFNFARAGATSKDVLVNQLPQALSAKPDIITLLIGINDLHNLTSLPEFEGNLNTIVKALKESNAKIYLLSIPYLGSSKIVYSPYNFILDFQTKQFNNVIKNVAISYEAQYVNLYQLRKAADFYSVDQFHPADEGYKEWAKAINVN